MNCLLDTGSEVTLISGSLVPKKLVTSQIRATNGTTIEVLVLADLLVFLRGRELLISGVAYDHIGEMLLGRLTRRAASNLDMRSEELYMHGSVFPLRLSETQVGCAGWWCRRLSEFIHV